MTQVAGNLQRKSPLDAIHTATNARMADLDGWLLPASYGNFGREYSAVRKEGAGVIDLSSRGKLLISGAEATPFLNGLITNDVKGLSPNRWMHAAFPNVQGRLQAAVRVINSPAGFLIDTESVTHDRVVQMLEKFTLAGDFKLEDLANELALVSVQGARSASLLSSLLPESESIERYGSKTFDWKGTSLTVIRATHTAEDGYDIFVDAKAAGSLWQALIDAGAVPIGFLALEVLRVEAGIPRFGVDMDETRVVLETGLDEAVSFTKGCYLGQEIIARIHFRGHVAKQLTGLIVQGGSEVHVAEKIFSTTHQEIGHVTSAVFSPVLNRQIALGYVKFDYLAPGTEVGLSSEKSKAALITELPFVKGSWYEKEESSETIT